MDVPPTLRGFQGDAPGSPLVVTSATCFATFVTKWKSGLCYLVDTRLKSMFYHFPSCLVPLSPEVLHSRWSTTPALRPSVQHPHLMFSTASTEVSHTTPSQQKMRGTCRFFDFWTKKNVCGRYEGLFYYVCSRCYPWGVVLGTCSMQLPASCERWISCRVNCICADRPGQKCNGYTVLRSCC